ncbi:syntaxin-like protein [Laccaria bicolor S238N-H82]|uniref:Syntaxin-like protein n=1 Tax=Laccaria bicolor (strain S238N-H82 / ATCC MYA-4686) TaxID=486041 RepID=B0E004_LACBS|nr:syntaxin-like protein [Laccaria bicolor S238N-H82]EDQ99814.1 syntaxin-like protein [Laccaria bicolor S238N-H82]|eukprot:XP_001889506.1 syntaxin-like protein [Laccaria bicolor S238N-H82]
MSLAKLTSVSTKTLSLLLERQRLQTLPSFSSPQDQPPKTNTLHLAQIKRNLTQLRTGILDLEAKEGPSEAVGLLRNQYDRMRDMLGDVHVSSLDKEEPTLSSTVASPSPVSPPNLFPPPPATREVKEPIYAPYADDPELGPDPGIMLQTQRHLMNEQDQHLDQLSHSINRQHHISLQINDELDVHHGLLEELDTDLDRTASRLGGARQRLERVAKGAKENGSAVTIAVLILLLLILIIVFKT